MRQNTIHSVMIRVLGKTNFLRHFSIKFFVFKGREQGECDTKAKAKEAVPGCGKAENGLRLFYLRRCFKKEKTCGFWRGGKTG